MRRSVNCQFGRNSFEVESLEHRRLMSATFTQLHPNIQVMVIGKDSSVYYSSPDSNAIKRILPSGKTASYLVPSKYGQPSNGVAAADGSVWFACGRTFTRISKRGKLSFLNPPLSNLASITGFNSLVAAPDGSVWYTCNFGRPEGDGHVFHNKIIYLPGLAGRVDTAGKFSEIAIPGNIVSKSLPLPSDQTNVPGALFVGSDGNVYTIENSAVFLSTVKTGVAMLKYDRNTGVQISPVDLHGLDVASWQSVTPGASDGNLWVTTNNSLQIYDLATFTLQGGEDWLPNDDNPKFTNLAADKSGNMWFTDANTKGVLYSMNENGDLSSYNLPGTESPTTPNGLTGYAVNTDFKGHVWIYDYELGVLDKLTRAMK